jgi:hypothetical protein
MMDFSGRVTGCKKISNIDLRKGCFQIFMHPDDIRKTAIITPCGLFEFLRLPFNLRNAGSTFVYLDAVILATKSMKQHQRDVEVVFRHLRSAGLAIYEKSASGM